MKKILRKFAPVALVFLGLATLSFMAKDSIVLRLQPQQGKTYTITSKSNMMTKMEVQGQSMTMSQTMENRQSFTAKQVTEAQSLIETQVEAIKMSVSQMGMKFEYDSEHPEKTSPILADQTAELEKNIKKLSTVTYTALGKYLGDDEELGHQLSNVILEFPEEELSVGSKWNLKKEQNVNDINSMVNMEYAVTSISKKSIELSLSGVVESSEVTGTYNGTASLDPKTGLLMSSTIKSNLSTTVNEQGMSIPMTIIGNTTTEVK